MKLVRIAFTRDEMVAFTPRGKSTDFYFRGFIRRNGKTITGVMWDAGLEFVFYPEGLNKYVAYQKEAA